MVVSGSQASGKQPRMLVPSFTVSFWNGRRRKWSMTHKWLTIGAFSGKTALSSSFRKELSFCAAQTLSKDVVPLQADSTSLWSFRRLVKICPSHYIQCSWQCSWFICKWSWLNCSLYHRSMGELEKFQQYVTRHFKQRWKAGWVGGRLKSTIWRLWHPA